LPKRALLSRGWYDGPACAATPVSPHPFASKTLDLLELAQPEIAPVAADLRWFARRLALGGTPFAVNGILRWRFHVRAHKMWEYARGVACVLQEKNKSGAGMRVLDFGGGATLPIFYLARAGCDVVSLDVDARLTDWTNQVAQKRGWKLRGSTYDLTEPAPTPGETLGEFDAVISFSVLEHLPKERQAPALERLVQRLKPGGVFVLTCDYGEDAPTEGAVRNDKELEALVAATPLAYLEGTGFTDTGERFALDKRHPRRRFTFASVFLRKPPK